MNNILIQLHTTIQPQSTTIQVNDYLSTTGSTIELELFNGGSGYTMGWELIRDGEVLYSNSCGNFGSFGCANDSQSTGIVYSATIALVDFQRLYRY